MLSRQNKAIAICLLSAAILAYFAIFRGRSAVSTLIELFIVWHFVASWLGNQLWLLGLKPREIHGETKHGGLRLSGLALGIERASFVWLGAAGLLWILDTTRG